MVTALIAGGGTGGHVFPMLAVGDAILARDPEARVVYVGTARGIEVHAIGEQGRELVLMDVAPLRGGGIAGFVKGAARAAGSIPEACGLVRRLAPSVVLSAGGYAGGPIALAARLIGVPVALLEPNSVLGLSNRMLTPFAERAFVAFPEAERYLRPSAVRRFGVPLRRAFAPVPYAPSAGAASILVLGGSQGALALNEAVPRAIGLARAQGVELRVVHQAGRDREGATRSLYRELGIEASVSVVPFIDEMAAAISAADLVIGRAGASSLAEICGVGRPSILIPYPFAADDHQRRNAESLVEKGAAVAVVQKDASPARLAEELTRLARDPSRRARMAAAAMALGRPDAAARIAEELCALASRRLSVKETS
jgi:UDP-N-acetylglucosamine--N-acetylmuramyl-(pentapeptide) pyrophosphoryl-undecaprenol N-acetylglucosamine transferase